jgi:hypothetical protein
VPEVEAEVETAEETPIAATIEDQEEALEADETGNRRLSGLRSQH